MNQKVLQDNEKLVHKFLDFTARILKTMQYLRDQTAIDYLQDLTMDYNLADAILHALLEEGYLEYLQWGAFPGCILSKKGCELLDELNQKHGPIQVPMVNCQDNVKIIRQVVWGETQEITAEMLTKHKLKITEDKIYLYLKFHLGVIKRTGVPYLRELVAESFLMDNLHFTYAQADEFIHILLEKGILQHDQFGAFPGTGVTKKGLLYYQKLCEKYSPDFLEENK